MIIEQTYYFINHNYDRNGFGKDTGELFYEYIHRCENDFHKRYIIFFANYLFANSFTMMLMKRCFRDQENSDFGVELIDMEINVEVFDKIEKFSTRETTYAIGSGAEGNEEEPLCLIIDDTIKDGIFILKYDSEDDDDDDDDGENDGININLPVDTDLITVKK